MLFLIVLFQMKTTAYLIFNFHDCRNGTFYNSTSCIYKAANLQDKLILNKQNIEVDV